MDVRAGREIQRSLHTQRSRRWRWHRPTRLRSTAPTTAAAVALELHPDRRDQTEIVLLDAGSGRFGLVIVECGELQLRSRGERARERRFQVIERIGEVTHFPERTRSLPERRRRRELPREKLLRIHRTARLG